ncbi:MAG: dockerin type I repeat-containing protein [Ruminococcus sp.]|uniref:dockerin type I repeat-containing protein n=1 Tax=Ruminococcus sp. TaxID=41978 RepID=UPI0025F5EEEA|nr:dockerin type I repeat-containing protein [Ruminococcus sp.]MCR5601981.1 dockerin type I repeat-containing protein [Ruminococcus sp.]
MNFRKITAAVMASALMACATSALTSSADYYYFKVLKGDINGDTEVDIEDYILVNNHVKGIKAIPSSRLAAADVNWDGKVDVTDVMLISYDINGVRPIRSGDVLDNGYVSSKDVKAIVNHINGVKALSSSRLKRADVNRDNVVNVVDVALIQNYLTK